MAVRYSWVMPAKAGLTIVWLVALGCVVSPGGRKRLRLTSAMTLV